MQMNHSKQPTIVSMEASDVSEVAEQFILCYYEMMHKSPDQLHRFYQNNSSMIYEDTPVFGQKNIHDKFMHLNLSNNSGVRVHVLQLDALKAHDKIVVQVAGEISANDCEWRRFMQTFVLGEVSSNNFFVMTDIFRFQDRVFAESANKEPVTKASTNPNLYSVYMPPQTEPTVEKPLITHPKEAPTKNTRQPTPISQQNGVDIPHREDHHEAPTMPVGHKGLPQTAVATLPQKEPVKVQPTQPVKEVTVISEPAAPKSWAQMASTAAANKPRPSEPVVNPVNTNEHPSNRGNSDRVNSARGGGVRHGRQTGLGDRERDHQEPRGEREGRGGHMRGSGAPRNTARGGAPIAVGGGRRN